jgi:spore maturation protein CgeB
LNKYIKKLYKDEKLRRKMGEKAFEKVLEKYNYEKNCEKYLNLIDEVIECAE